MLGLYALLKTLHNLLIATWLGMNFGTFYTYRRLRDAISLATLDQISGIRTMLDETAEQADRDPREIRISAVINTCIQSTREQARAFLRKNLMGYFTMPFYEASLRRCRVEVIDGEVPDAAVDSLALAGQPEWARAHLGAFRTAGVDVPVLAPT